MIVAWGGEPDHPDLWPVRWASSSQEALSHRQALLIDPREIAYYHNGEKIFTSQTCYDSLKRGQHRFFPELLKRQGHRPETLLDPTAGWGREALSAAMSGINVTVMEKQPLPVCFLLYARQYLYPKLLPNLHIVPGCFSQHHFAADNFECIFLDPLFFEQKKSASKKAMSLLYDARSEPQNQNQLLVQGLERLHPKTLVLKQPLKAPQASLPHVLCHSRPSRSCRYDIFYINQQPLSYATLFS